ncbi:MAG: glutamate-5-semialdehyde dehydrogenase [Pseudomonadales bacterium]|jgi:glutamate-5-semialdehyde dehydrogenase|nr:glutamate-5-semialdehyde dehydrogenase [Pseudomonadales bacterium]MDP6828109.1 glutamate-5-semialdehyde dehydrogenase [Pseudomonadales bacterium]
MTVLSSTGEVFTVSERLAAEFEPGDTIVANSQAGLLRIPAREQQIASDAVTACAASFEAMDSVSDAQIVSFFHAFASALADDGVWDRIVGVNAADVEAARARGRSTTRLAVSEAMRQNMIEGLRGWATTPSRRDAVLEKIDHEGFRIELVGAALGIVAFVFEGRPNVLADACGVLRGGNSVIFRIGSDALSTAREIMDLAVRPSLLGARLPEYALTLIDSPAHAAGWSLFLDRRLSLAVARGSGPAVDLLGSLAQSAGTPVSLHGTGGAWMVVSAGARAETLRTAVTRSLDRKVCNTLNTCCIPRSGAARLVPELLAALAQAGEARSQNFKLHVAEDSLDSVPSELFESRVRIVRADGAREEPQAQPIALTDLGVEWEWEESPEITLVVVDGVDDAIDLFNEYSPRLVASLITEDSAEVARFWDRVRSPFVGDAHTRWVDGQFALAKPELGLSNWANGRLFGRGAILTGDSVYTVRTRFVTT